MSPSKKKPRVKKVKAWAIVEKNDKNMRLWKINLWAHIAYHQPIFLKKSEAEKWCKQWSNFRPYQIEITYQDNK